MIQWPPRLCFLCTACSQLSHPVPCYSPCILIPMYFPVSDVHYTPRGLWSWEAPSQSLRSGPSFPRHPTGSCPHVWQSLSDVSSMSMPWWVYLVWPLLLTERSCLLNCCIIYLLYLLDIKISIFDYAVWNNRWSQGNLEIAMHFSHFWSQGSPRPRSWQVQRLGDVSASIGSQCLLAVHGWPALGLTVKNDWPRFRT